MTTDRPTITVAALAALVWVVAATLHEGLGHGVACAVLGGDPTTWSTFHFACAHDGMPVARWRIVAGAGTAVNVALMALGWLAWRRTTGATIRLAGWIAFAVNGLTTFGYLVFSAAFGIGDWNTSGVMIGAGDVPLARALLAVLGIAGYAGIVRAGAAMLSPLLDGDTFQADARRITTTIWLTTGVVSLLAAFMAGSGWRATLGASIGVALGGNAGLLSIPRFLSPSPGSRPVALGGGTPLRIAAILAVLAFVLILGPGVSL